MLILVIIIPRRKQKIKFLRKFACKHLTPKEDISNSLQPLCYCQERELVLGSKAYICQVCSLYVQTNNKTSEIYEESKIAAENKIKEKQIELSEFELAEIKSDEEMDLSIDEFEEEDDEIAEKFEKRKVGKEDLEDSEEFAELECPFCGEISNDLRSHIQECEFAPEDASIDDIIPTRKKKKGRKKKPQKKSPKTTGKVEEKEKKTCPYCGKEFIRLGRHIKSCPKKPEDADES